MIEVDSTVRKTVARLLASFQLSDQGDSRLQCSPASSAGACAPSSLPGSSLAVVTIGLLEACVPTPPERPRTPVGRVVRNPGLQGRRRAQITASKPVPAVALG